MATSKILEELFSTERKVKEVLKRIGKRPAINPVPMRTPWTLVNTTGGVVYQASQDSPCFGSLPLEIFQNRATVRFLKYTPIYNMHYLTNDEIERWFRLCMEMGLLPTDQSPHALRTNGIKIDLDSPEATMPRVYMALCLMRWTRESALIVRSARELIEEAGRDFWASVAYAHARYCGRPAHSLLPFNGAYASGGHQKTASRDARIVRRTHELTRQPDSIDARHFKTEIIQEYGAERALKWGWFASVMKPDTNHVLGCKEALLSSKLLPYYQTNDNEHANSIIEYLKESSNELGI